MPLTGSMSTNDDKTKNYSITGTKENETNNVSVTGFVNGLRTEVDLLKPNAPQYNSAGLSVGVENSGGSLGVTGTHIPNRANIATASASLNLLHNDIHKMTANAFSTQTMPKVGPNFGTHGGGLDYSYKEQFGANASVAHTPMFKQTDYSVGGRMNLHQTPTSSLDLGFGASQSRSPHGKTNWGPNMSFGFKKTF